MPNGVFTQLDVFVSNYPSFCSSKYCSSVKSLMPISAVKSIAEVFLVYFLSAIPSLYDRNTDSRGLWSFPLSNQRKGIRPTSCHPAPHLARRLWIPFHEVTRVYQHWLPAVLGPATTQDLDDASCGVQSEHSRCQAVLSVVLMSAPFSSRFLGLSLVHTSCH